MIYANRHLHDRDKYEQKQVYVNFDTFLVDYLILSDIIDKLTTMEKELAPF